jgi:hypothetical protein
MRQWKDYAKAIVGALVAGLGALSTALEDNAVNGQEWVTVATAFLVAFGAVWSVPNLKAKKPEKH